MAAPLSMDLRVRIVRLVKAGWSARRTTARFEVSPSAAIKLMARVRRRGSAQPGRLGGTRRPVLEPHAELLRALVAGGVDLTLDELCRELSTRGIATSRSAFHRMLRRLGLTLKKKSLRAAEQDRSKGERSGRLRLGRVIGRSAAPPPPAGHEPLDAAAGMSSIARRGGGRSGQPYQYPASLWGVPRKKRGGIANRVRSSAALASGATAPGCVMRRRASPLFCLAALLAAPACAGTSMISGEAAPEMQTLARRAQAGDKQAQLDLGIRLEEGKGVPRDTRRAMKLYRMAAADSGGMQMMYVPHKNYVRAVPVSRGRSSPGLTVAQEREVRARLSYLTKRGGGPLQLTANGTQRNLLDTTIVRL